MPTPEPQGISHNNLWTDADDPAAVAVVETATGSDGLLANPDRSHSNYPIIRSALEGIGPQIRAFLDSRRGCKVRVIYPAEARQMRDEIEARAKQPGRKVMP